MERAPFKLKSGNTSAFKNLGASPAKQKIDLKKFPKGYFDNQPTNAKAKELKGTLKSDSVTVGDIALKGLAAGAGLPTGGGSKRIRREVVNETTKVVKKAKKRVKKTAKKVWNKAKQIWNYEV